MTIHDWILGLDGLKVFGERLKISEISSSDAGSKCARVYAIAELHLPDAARLVSTCAGARCGDVARLYRPR